MRKCAFFVSLLVSASLLCAFCAQTSAQSQYTVNFNVSSFGNVTVSISGIPEGHIVDLHYGVEAQPQGSWNTVFDKNMTWNGSAYVTTIGPFQNGTWVAWVFHDLTTGAWINFDNHPFWNWNLLVNPLPSELGNTNAQVLSNGSILITTIGRAPDPLDLHYGLTTGFRTGLPWSQVSDLLMGFNPLEGEYYALIGPFTPGQWVQWVYHDLYTNQYYHNDTYYNFAIQDVYSPLTLVSSNYTRFVFITSQSITLNLWIKSGYSTAQKVNISVQVDGKNFVEQQTLTPGLNYIPFTFSANLSQGVYQPRLSIKQGSSALLFATLPPLYVLNTQDKKPLSVVIVWNMHQPLYLEPNGSWAQPWVVLHTGEDFVWNGQLVGSYELQALLLKQYNVSVTIDFTPVLLYQWETLLNKSFSYIGHYNGNITHDLIAIKYTLQLYKQLVEQGRVEVLTVPFYHPLMPIEYDNGWGSDLLSQLLMGENMTHLVFGVWASGVWTPEEAFNMALVHLYNESNISYTILDEQAFLPYVTLVSGSLNPDQPFVVQDSVGERLTVLFRNTTLSNEFSFQFFSQSPELTQEELIQQLAQIYMREPGGVVVIALDGENPLIFNPLTGPQDLNAIYKALSSYQGAWFVTQTASEAIATHSASVITNLPESSWNLNLNYWNNGYLEKTAIWHSVAQAREYLIAFTVAARGEVSPIVWTPPASAPNSTNVLQTLWNYLYIAEGSDWTWQTGPPANGPAWFEAQAMVYTNAIVNEVTQMFNEITLTKYEINHNHVDLTIENRLPFSMSLTLVASTTGKTVVQTVVLEPGKNHVKIKGITGGQLMIELYSPISPNDLGDHPIALSQYGFLIRSFVIDESAQSAKSLASSLFAVLVVVLMALALFLAKKRV